MSDLKNSYSANGKPLNGNGLNGNGHIGSNGNGEKDYYEPRTQLVGLCDGCRARVGVWWSAPGQSDG